MVNEECNFCNEAKLKVGDISSYGSTIIYKIGDEKNGWFATLSPKTGGDPGKDFCIQIMPSSHLQHISDIDTNLDLAKNYGLVFAKLSSAINAIMKEEERHNENSEKVVRIGTYGKSKHPEEHFHVKLFPWAGKIGQPYTVDSTFEHNNIHKDQDGTEFIKMQPVKKTMIPESRYSSLVDKFISLLNN
ncbi:hypothetical protein CMI46_01315 [Candidatus Pacearchaeota archaeon]|nr:hypothetical protein [Candidatus Pacearchaeota archaeon]|tara:strand:+ start:12252 stop:12815 length:564 start_codon:yes stop_codon:yes gene_type:complete